MKKILTLLTIVLSVCTLAKAQNGQRGEEYMKAYKQRLVDSIGLSEAKADSVMSVVSSYQPQQREIFMDQSTSREDKMAKLKTLTDERNTKLKTILTDDQLAKLEAMEQRAREKMRQGAAGGGQQ
jgi:protein-disulfide isomerase-like protein with CxxC motif